MNKKAKVLKILESKLSVQRKFSILRAKAIQVHGVLPASASAVFISALKRLICCRKNSTTNQEKKRCLAEMQRKMKILK